MRPGTPRRVVAPVTGRSSHQLMHAAATLYYVRDETQADVARTLGVSRPTVSRLLAEARRLGIVRIEVVDPAATGSIQLGNQVAQILGLRRVLVAPTVHESVLGVTLAGPVGDALREVGLTRDDVLLVSSGRTIWEVGMHVLPVLAGVVVTPTVGGQDEPEAWYQTNEITRMIADKIGGRPVFLHAPAQPSPALYGQLMEDPGIQRVLDLWKGAKCALLGVGAPPSVRASMPGFVPRGSSSLDASAGDICTRFFDPAGLEVQYPGSDRLIATSYDLLRSLPSTIAVAVGAAKVPSILAGAQSGWFNTLVTDHTTANALVARAAP